MATVNPATLLSKSIDGWLYLLATWLGKKKASTLGVKAVGKHQLVAIKHEPKMIAIMLYPISKLFSRCRFCFRKALGFHCRQSLQVACLISMIIPPFWLLSKQKDAASAASLFEPLVMTLSLEEFRMILQ